MSAPRIDDANEQELTHRADVPWPKARTPFNPRAVMFRQTILSTREIRKLHNIYIYMYLTRRCNRIEMTEQPPHMVRTLLHMACMLLLCSAKRGHALLTNETSCDRHRSRMVVRVRQEVSLVGAAPQTLQAADWTAQSMLCGRSTLIRIWKRLATSCPQAARSTRAETCTHPNHLKQRSPRNTPVSMHAFMRASLLSADVVG